MNVQQFAQSIRAKYPSGIASDGTSYADIPDEELARRVVEKHPEYKDQIDDLPKEQGAIGKFVTGVKQAFGERKEEIVKQYQKPVDEKKALGLKAISPGLDRKSLRITGQAAGFVGDVQFEALKLIAPQFVEDWVSAGVDEVAKTQVVQDLAQKYNELKEKHPEAMRDVEDVVNIASIIGELELAGKAVKKTKSAFGKISSVTGDAIDARRVARITAASDEIDDVVGKIVQGKKGDIKKAKKALSSIDTAGVKTYSDLKGKIDDGIEALANKVDDRLDEVAGSFRPDDVAQITKVGAKTVKQNYVDDALDQLEELYVKVKEPTSYAEIANLKEKYLTEGLTAREMNDLARRYGREFKKKAFTKLGEPTTSIVGEAYENTRKGIKKTIRDLMPDNVTKMLDQRMSEMYNTSRLVNRAEESVNKLYQKVQKRGLLKRISMKVATVADTATFGTISGFISRFLPSNVGLKKMNWIEIEKALTKNLKKINKLIDTSDIKVLEDGVVDILKSSIVSEKPTKLIKIGTETIKKPLKPLEEASRLLEGNKSKLLEAPVKGKIYGKDFVLTEKVVAKNLEVSKGINYFRKAMENYNKNSTTTNLKRLINARKKMINLIPEVKASENYISNVEIKGDKVELVYSDQEGPTHVETKDIYKDRNFIEKTLGKVVNDIAELVGIKDLGTPSREEELQHYIDLAEEVNNTVAPETKPEPTPEVKGTQVASLVVKSGGKDQEITEKEVPEDISNVISEAFGEDAQDAVDILHHPYGKQKKGEGQGENAGFQVSDITVSNEGYDEGHDRKQFVHDVKGKDGKWHSVDKGLFRINNRTFQTYLFGKEERKLMYEAGIIDDPIKSGKISKADVEKAWEGMDDLEKNVKMAKIIYDKQGWDAWYAAPAKLVKNVIQ